MGLLFKDEFILIALLCCMLVCAGAGVYLLVAAGVRKEAFERLLQQGDYTPEKKAEEKKNAPIAACYWAVVTAIYLAVSFWTMRWDRTWILWPCAGALFGAVTAVAALLRKRK